MSKEKYIVPRGTQDVFGDNVKEWHYLENLIKEITDLYNIQEFRTPMYEHTEVFSRSGDASDMVNKEMYTFIIKKNDGESPSYTLRPEGTAGLVRAYVQHKLYGSGPSLQKYYYVAPNFRYERPQKGRMRIHHQFGVEFIGPTSPLVDVEAIQVGLSVLKRLGVKNYKVLINTIGDAESQKQYRQVLKEHFSQHIDTMCSDCKRRLEQNPLRILDCKVDHDHPALLSAPISVDSLNQESSDYFNKLKAIMDDLNIEYEVDNRLVRGLDYYNHTVFEVVSTNELTGAQSTIFAGGRYDGLVEYYGGPSTGAVGFGIGLERLLLFIKDEGINLDIEDSIDVYGMPKDETSNIYVYQFIQALRDRNISADMDLENKSMKAQFKMSDRNHSKVVVICGENEKHDNTYTIKNIETQEQVTQSFNEAIETIESWLTNE